MADDPLDPMQPEVLGARIREAREERGWTQNDLADRLKLDLSRVEAIENGEHRLKASQIIELASVLDYPVCELVEQRGPVQELFAQFRHDRRASGHLGGQGATVEEMFPPDYIAMAVKAWEEGELSEGQVARLLRTDRLGAREVILRLTQPEETL